MTDEAVSPGTIPVETSNTATSPKRWRKRLTLIAVAVTLLAAAIVLPPLINISRYQRQVTALMSRSLGRPVRLSGVELRLLPLPGFVIHDLSVSEDPAFGGEPILSARTVGASVNIFSLWGGKLSINRISVDEASLNLVRSSTGQWNLQSLLSGSLMNGAQRNNSTSSQPSKPRAFPYLEATNSRINIKQGFEKSPYSLVSAELSLWQDSPGAWRLRLRGQPVRTDMEMSLADTGEVRVEASLQSSSPAHELREMPLRLQGEWRDAQLGQLSRLLTGSDAGWRGDLTADIDVQGTPEAANTKARLRATGVRRAEFAPQTPLDFDANCSFLYQRSVRYYHNIACDTSIGGGLLHLKADLPGNGAPKAMLEVNQLPLQAGLDLLRTVRSGFAPGIEAHGDLSGSLSLAEPQLPAKPARHSTAAERAMLRNQASLEPLSLQGSIVTANGQLTGGALKQTLTLPKITWTPVAVPDLDDPRGYDTGLGTRFGLSLGSAPALSPANANQSTSNPSGTATPKSRPQDLAVRLTLTRHGYESTLTGATGIAQFRDLAYAFGAPHNSAADGFSSGSAEIDVSAAGPWISTNDPIPVSETAVATSTKLPSTPAVPNRPPGADRLSGSIKLVRAAWQAPYLARPVEFPNAAVSLFGPVPVLTADFIYGPLNGNATVDLPFSCDTEDCQPVLQLHLGTVDAVVIEAALLGAPEKKTLLSPLIDRLRSSDHPQLPAMRVQVQADSIGLGTATLHKATLHLKLQSSGVDIPKWEGELLGGAISGTGHSGWTFNGLEYAVDANFSGIPPSGLETLFVPKPDSVSETKTDPASNFTPSVNWSGAPISGSGTLRLSGLTSKELIASANGSVHFTWPRGSIQITTTSGETPPSQAIQRFDEWSGTANISGGKVQLADNAMRQGKRTIQLGGSFPIGEPPHFALTETAPTAKPPARASK